MLLDEGVLLATVGAVELLLVLVAGAPELLARGVAVVELVVAGAPLLVELVEPLVMRVLLAVLAAAVDAVVLDPLDEELDEPSSTQADTKIAAVMVLNVFASWAARGRVVATLNPSLVLFAWRQSPRI